jgi:hypothetical protein
MENDWKTEKIVNKKRGHIRAFMTNSIKRENHVKDKTLAIF